MKKEDCGVDVGTVHHYRNWSSVMEWNDKSFTIIGSSQHHITIPTLLHTLKEQRETVCDADWPSRDEAGLVLTHCSIPSPLSLR